ncbi:MAG: thiamine pyrophosphokinase [Oscillospiraceae bacterium]|nr:thiamine pyrophosphokinase [Oscillospiraceae bacterium]
MTDQTLCYIFGAGTITPDSLCLAQPRYVIAADAGLAYLQAHEIPADLVLGDFDSLGEIPEHPRLLLYPSQKNDTDMLLAVREGLSRGYQTFLLYGGMGGRLDHTIANLQTLSFLAERGAAGYLIGNGTAATAVKNGTLRFPHHCTGIISVFSFDGTAHDVTLRGLKYELSDYEMTSSFPIGVSNEFTGAPCSISVSDGTLLVLWPHDETRPVDYILRSTSL